MARDKKLLRWYVHHKNYINKGMGELYYIKMLIQSSAGLSIVLKLFINPEPKVYAYILVAFSVLMLTGCWLIGWFWDLVKGYDVEVEWNRLRDPFAKDVRKFIKVKRCT